MAKSKGKTKVDKPLPRVQSTWRDDGESFKALVGANVRALRRKASLSRQALAVAAGMSWGGVAKIEDGDTVPSLGTAFALADVLGCQVDDFRRPTP